MKKYLQAAAVIVFILLILPILPLLGAKPDLQDNNPNHAESESSAAPSSETAEESASSQADTPVSGDTISVFNYTTEQVETMNMLDYLTGVVCAEIPPTFSEEAIKAQAVVAHTYALYVAAQEQASPTAELQGAQISTGTSRHQGYYSDEELKERYGKHYEEYKSKISNCVSAVYHDVLTYDGAPILAAFHAVSNGMTESSENVWGNPLPYLVSVSSEGDSLTEDFTHTASFSSQEVKDILSAEFSDLDFSADKESWFVVQSKTPSGYVNALTVLGQATDGQTIRSLFSLRSADFTVSYEKDTFTFTTRGYGHGVGLSQCGAEYFAEQGQTYTEILAHYYPGTTLEQR